MNLFIKKVSVRIDLVISVAICLLLLCPAATFAQRSVAGQPLSFQAQANGRQFAVKSVTLQTRIDNTQEKIRVASRDSMHLGYIPYGKGIAARINIKQDGSMQQLQDGTKVWLLKIKSETALGLQLHFDRFKLPKDAKLFIYSEDRSDVLGAYTHINNNPNEQFAIEILKGEALVMEYSEPRNPEFSGILHVNRVIHVFDNAFERLGEFGYAGACNVNVNCEPMFTNESKAVTRIALYDIQANYAGAASGSLINSVSTKSYVLSANHIFDPTTPNQYFSSWIFYFNYEFPGCQTTTIEPNPHNTIQGARIRSRGTLSDYMLLELSSNPKDNYAVNYLGWDATGFIPHSGAVSIHHPKGDVKKISLWYPNTAPDPDDVVPDPVLVRTQISGVAITELPGSPTDYRMFWVDGITQRGSSGGPLIDMQSKRIIGQLRGGASSCLGANVYTNGQDYYGLFSVSMTNPDSGYPSLRSLLADGSSTLTQINGDYNGGPTSQPTIVITDITLTSNKFDPPNNKLVPSLQVTGNPGILTYSWSPAADFTHPNLSPGLINFGLTNNPPVLPLTRTYTLTITPQYGSVVTKSVTVTLYDCRNRTFAKFIHPNAPIDLGRPGSPAETYLWTPSTNLSSDVVSDPVFTAPAEGTYTFILKATSNACVRTESYSIYAENSQIPSSVNMSFNRQVAKPLEPDYYYGPLIPTSFGYVQSKEYSKSYQPGTVEIVKMNRSFTDLGSTLLPLDLIDEVYGITKLSDGYMVTGKKTKTGPFHIIAIRLDENLNILWYNKDVGAAGVIPQPDGSFLFPVPGYSAGTLGRIHKVSSTGVSDWYASISPIDDVFINSITQVGPDEFLLISRNRVVKARLVPHVPGLKKFETIWIRSIADVALYNTIQKVLPLEDGSTLVLSNLATPLSTLHTEWIRLIKLNPAGEILWEKRFYGMIASPYAVFAKDIIKLSSGDFMISASSNSVAAMHKSEDTRGDTDIWLIKITPDGKLIGDLTIGGNKSDFGAVIREIEPGVYAGTIQTSSTLSGDKTVGNPTEYHRWYFEFREGGECTTPQAVITPSGSTQLCNSSVTLSGNAGSNLLYKWYLNNVLVGQSRTITVSSDNPGNYKLVLFKPNSCYTEARTYVYAVNASLSTTTTTICEGSSVTLSASAFNNMIAMELFTFQLQRYSGGWVNSGASQTNPTASFTVTAVGRYRVKATLMSTLGNCYDYSDEITLTSGANPKPSIAILSSVCDTGYELLSASTGYSSYRWSNGQTTRSINGYPGNTYTVTATNANGCQNTSNPRTVYPCVGNEPCTYYSSVAGRERPCDEIPPAAEVLISKAIFYPNPASHVLTVMLPDGSSKDLKVILISPMGRAVSSGTIKAGNVTETFDTQQLPNGIYIAEIRVSDKIFIRKKIMIKH